MKKLSLYLCVVLFACAQQAQAQQSPKREFRGTWVHTVGNTSYKTMTTAQLQDDFRKLLDTFQMAGINAVIFQVRPQADAFYVSTIEPWSRFITGVQGKAPTPIWDPLAFMVEECHKRGMELHAWFNPYRVTSNDKEVLMKNHLYYKKPEMFVKYGKQIYFDPGNPESRKHTVKVIADVVSRYDIDAVHFDDYFYPYRIAGKEFPDEKSYQKYGKVDGFTGKAQKDDWRRNNVNILVHELSDTIKKIKPWVKFGISPFGVWRNKSVDPTGSNSQAGQTNYDDLFADIKLWVDKEWIDYNVPQLYWEIGHPKADYTPLIEWWSANNAGCQLYIGQNVATTVKVKKADGKSESQLARKMQMVRENPNIQGNVWWPGYSIRKNPDGFTDSISAGYQHYPALVPQFKYIDSIPPAPVQQLAVKKVQGGMQLWWEAVPATNEMDKAAYFCVYRFAANEVINLDDATKLLKVVRQPKYLIPEADTKKQYKYVVTALDRLYNESAPQELVL